MVIAMKSGRPMVAPTKGYSLNLMTLGANCVCPEMQLFEIGTMIYSNINLTKINNEIKVKKQVNKKV